VGVDGYARPQLWSWARSGGVGCEWTVLIRPGPGWRDPPIGPRTLVLVSVLGSLGHSRPHFDAIQLVWYSFLGLECLLF